MNANDLFAKIEEFITEARQETADAAGKAADVVDQISSWLRTQAASLKPLPLAASTAESAHAAPVAACCDKLKAFIAEPARAKAGTEAAVGALPWKQIAAAILAFIQTIGPWLV